MTGLLHALLRLEADAVERWRASESAVGIEHALSPRRMEQLTDCIPLIGMSSLLHALGQAVMLGGEICAHIRAEHGWAWPETLASRISALIATPASAKDSSQNMDGE